VFFVQDFEGTSEYSERKEFEPAVGAKLVVRFKDGEVLEGTSLSYDAGRDGFFIFPPDRITPKMRRRRSRQLRVRRWLTP
jgi:hypothetical protein